MSCLKTKRTSGILNTMLSMFAVFVLLFSTLPAYAERLPEFLSKIQPAEIFPGADRYGKPEGKPMVARVYKGDEQLGLVYITTDVVNTRGYSSKPIDTMVALANDGTVAGAKLVDHHEPIMLIGIPQSRVDKFIDKYIGLNFIKNPPTPGVAPGDIISGATVTLMVINDSIQRSFKVVAGNMVWVPTKPFRRPLPVLWIRNRLPNLQLKPALAALSIRTNRTSNLGMPFWNKKPSVICIFQWMKSTSCLKKAAKPVLPTTPNKAQATIPLSICILP